jgi:cobalamin biosynthesis Mg chelatase CobN
MANENTPEQKPTNGAVSTSTTRKGKGKGSERPRIGGTAVPGAKSTQPKQVSSSGNAQQQQQEYSNRVMRRQMERRGLGPESDTERMQEAMAKRNKKRDRKKQQIEERRQEIRKALPAGGIKLGRKNLYFIIGTVAAIILLIVIFLIVRHPFS